MLRTRPCSIQNVLAGSFQTRTGGKVIFDELRQVLKKTTKIGDIDRSVMKNLYLNEAQVGRLAKDVTENDTLPHALKESLTLARAWKRLDEAGLAALRKNVDGLNMQMN